MRSPFMILVTTSGTDTCLHQIAISLAWQVARAIRVERCEAVDCCLPPSVSSRGRLRIVLRAGLVCVCVLGAWCEWGVGWPVRNREN